jgi:hypothetical protein
MSGLAIVDHGLSHFECSVGILEIRTAKVVEANWQPVASCICEAPPGDIRRQPYRSLACFKMPKFGGLELGNIFVSMRQCFLVFL